MKEQWSRGIHYVTPRYVANLLTGSDVQGRYIVVLLLIGYERT